MAEDAAVNWTMVFVATIVSLLPIFLNCDQQRRGYPTGHFADLLNNNSNLRAPVDSTTVLSIITDDEIVQTNDLNVSMIMGPFLGMCLPAFLDLLVDVYVAVTQPTTRGMNNALKIVRLSLLERFVFILGVFCNGFYFLIPLDWNVMVRYTVQQVTNRVGLILLSAPLIIFLERSTNIFSPFFTTLIIMLMSSGGAMIGYKMGLTTDTMAYQEINVLSTFIILAYFCLVLSACLWSFLKFLFHQHTKAESAAGGIQKQHLDPFQDFSVNHVPACHMVTLCIGYCVSLSWFLSPNKVPQSTNNLLFALMLFSEALVFVIEMRVRQNEIVHGLHLLNSKRAFVRFISHEVRMCTLYILCS